MGIDPDRYWDLPFWQLGLEMAALNKRRNEDMIITAWRTGYYMRIKNWPDLKQELMTDEERKKKDRESRGFVESLIESGEDIYTGGKIVNSEPGNK